MIVDVAAIEGIVRKRLEASKAREAAGLFCANTAWSAYQKALQNTLEDLERLQGREATVHETNAYGGETTQKG